MVDALPISDKTVQEIFEQRVVSEFFENAKSAQNRQPQAVLLGGQPGAGKGGSQIRIKQSLLDKTGQKPVFLDMDSMREYHPDFEQLNKQNDKLSGYATNKLANQLFEKAIQYGIDNKFDLIIEGTFKRPENVMQQAQMLKGSGYRVDAEVVSTPYPISKLSTQKRYEQSKHKLGYGRLTPTEPHDSAYRNCPATLEMLQKEKLVDSISVVRRDGSVAYQTELQQGKWTNKDDVAVAYAMDRERKINQSEAKYLQSDIKQLHDLVGRKGRNPEPSDKASLYSHTYLCNELLVKSGFEPVKENQSIEKTAQGVLNELAAGAATSEKHAKAYSGILREMDERFASTQKQQEKNFVRAKSNRSVTPVDKDKKPPSDIER